MKKAVSLRLDPELLAKARRRADSENRTLTNFVETVLREAVDTGGKGMARAAKPTLVGRR